jgi:hypothetical protein
MPSYKKRTWNVFKDFFSRDKYRFKPCARVSEVHEYIVKERKQKIREKTIGKHLEKYEMKRNGDSVYRNPFVWDAFLIIESIFETNIAPPTSINGDEDRQRQYGIKPGQVSISIERRLKKKIPEDAIRYWLREWYSDKIREGPDDYFYVSSR